VRLRNNCSCFRRARETQLTNSNRNRNRKPKISTAPTKEKSREPAYSQALIQKNW